MTPHKVLCVDPGPHVGLATWTDRHETDPGFTNSTWTERFQAWTDTPEHFYADVANWVKWADVIVCEGFVISGSRSKEANITIEMIGVLRYLAALSHKPFVVQAPGAYKFAGSDKLKRLGWYTPGPDHARSASGHLVKYLAERQLIDAARLLPVLPSATDGGG